MRKKKEEKKKKKNRIKWKAQKTGNEKTTALRP